MTTNSANYVRDDTFQTELLEGSLAEFGAAETFSMLLVKPKVPSIHPSIIQRA